MTHVTWAPLLGAVASDCGCDSYTISYLVRRLNSEGVRFLTVNLPKLGKSVLRSMELKKFVRPTDFAWKARSLRYFRSLLDKIFCHKTGDLLDDYCVISFNYIRQLCEYAYKLGLAFTPEQNSVAEAKYLAVNRELGDLSYDPTWLEKLRKAAENYYKPLFKTEVHEILSHGTRPGPGAFVGSDLTRRTAGVPWYIWKINPQCVTGTCNSSQTPFSGYFKPYPSAPTPIIPVEESRICQVRFVKKDSRGPRVISKEPYHQLRAQMAFFSWSSRTLELVSRCRINFVDQSVNQRLAKSSSIDGSNATLDLKDASDRIGYKLARHVFSNAPGVSYFLRNFRSTHFELPSGRRGRLSAVAGMGSGLTFPLLAFFVQLSVCVAVVDRTGLPFEEVRSFVYVYGDDLIVPTRWVEYAFKGLEKSGLLVNHDKSYWRGPFRESCGGDYINGNECAPVRLKLHSCDLPSPKECRDGFSFTRFDAEIVKALVAHSHELRRSGMNATASFWEISLSKVIPMPYVGYGSPVLGRYTWDSSLVYQQACGGDAGSPDGYIFKAARVLPVLEDSRTRCPYKFLGGSLKPKTLQSGIGIPDGVALAYDLSPVPRKSRIRIGKTPIISATRVAGI